MSNAKNKDIFNRVVKVLQNDEITESERIEEVDKLLNELCETLEDLPDTEELVDDICDETTEVE